MNTFNWLVNHLGDIFAILLLFFIFTIKFIPPHLAGLDKEYFDTSQNKIVSQKNQSILDAITTAIFFTSIRSLLTVLTLKGTTSLLMFAVIGVDLITHKSISNNVVIISVVGIIALYADHLVMNAEEFSIGGKLFQYKRRSS